MRGVLGGGAAGPSQPLRSPVALEEIDYSAVPDWAEPYAVAEIGPRPWFCEPHEEGAEPDMRTAVQEIVSVEGPVHIEVVRQRLRDRWRIGQIGSRIRARLDSAICTSGVARDGEFLHVKDRPAIRVRTPVGDCSRTVEQIHGSELELAIVNLVRDAGSITADDATVNVARLYGWARVGSEIRSTLDATTEKLLADGRLVSADGDLSVPS
ncbi:MAG: DUF3320 domain-containing protein [Actinomycetia bacterium]|nr:DUF3320 domain-containing protein [Actinomycetes bacterium]